MSMKQFAVAASLAVLALTSTAASAAAIKGVDFTGVGTTNGGSVYGLGYKFLANTSATVSGLGVFDLNKDGLAGPQLVGLWDANGTLLASTTVTNSDALDGFWRFHDITGVTLTAGNIYYVTAQGGEGYTYGTTGFSVNSNITYLTDAMANVSSNSSPLVFPTVTGQLSPIIGNGFFGGNIAFAPADVPEPFSLALVGIGLAGVGATRRKRK